MLRAERIWEAVYPALTADRPGMLGAITARAEAQCSGSRSSTPCWIPRRLIHRPHLEAAFALWQYAEDSAHTSSVMPWAIPIADRVLSALRANGPDEPERALRSLRAPSSAARLSGAWRRCSDSAKSDPARRDRRAADHALGGRPMSRTLFSLFSLLVAILQEKAQHELPRHCPCHCCGMRKKREEAKESPSRSRA